VTATKPKEAKPAPRNNAAGAQPRVTQPVNATAAAQAALDTKMGNLDQARDTNLLPKIGASTYTIARQAIENLPQGDNTPIDKVILQMPGVSYDSAVSNPSLHVRNEYANVQISIPTFRPLGFLGMARDPILIVGGGLGGLTTALALSHRGLVACVLEGAPEFSAIGYGSLRAFRTTSRSRRRWYPARAPSRYVQCEVYYNERRKCTTGHRDRPRTMR